MNQTHRVSARTHARKRLAERYGFWITKKTYRELCDEIADGSTARVAVSPDGSSIHRMYIKSMSVYAVWNPDLQCIVTFLERKPTELARRQPAQATA